MSDAPKRVWLILDEYGEIMGFDYPDGEHPWPPQNLGPEYVRADLFAELEAEVERWKKSHASAVEDRNELLLEKEASGP